MLAYSLLVGIQLLAVHGPDGQTIYVNPAEISSLRQPTNADLGRYFPRTVHCIVVTTNGKFVAAVERCDVLRDRLIKQGLGGE